MTETTSTSRRARLEEELGLLQADVASLCSKLQRTPFAGLIEAGARRRPPGAALFGFSDRSAFAGPAASQQLATTSTSSALAPSSAASAALGGDAPLREGTSLGKIARLQRALLRPVSRE